MKIISISQCVNRVYLPLYPQDASKEVPMKSISNSKKRPEMREHQDDEAIREESKNWNAQQWESYLQTVERGRSESLSTRTEVERLGITLNIFDLADTDCSEEISTLVRSLLDKLSNRQAFVLKMIFWHGKSERQIAKMMGSSRQAVYDLKKRALKNLRISFHEVLATSRIGEAQDCDVEIETGADGENPAA